MSFTLTDFFANLDCYTESLSLDYLTDRLSELEISLDDVRGHLQFGDKTYKRNLIHQGVSYQALVLCWRSGQRSPIHDHSGSICGVRVLSGLAIETRFWSWGPIRSRATPGRNSPIPFTLSAMEPEFNVSPR